MTHEAPGLRLITGSLSIPFCRDGAFLVSVDDGSSAAGLSCDDLHPRLGDQDTRRQRVCEPDSREIWIHQHGPGECPETRSAKLTQSLCLHLDLEVLCVVFKLLIC